MFEPGRFLDVVWAAGAQDFLIGSGAILQAGQQQAAAGGEQADRHRADGQTDKV